MSGGINSSCEVLEVHTLWKAGIKALLIYEEVGRKYRDEMCKVLEGIGCSKCGLDVGLRSTSGTD